MTVKRKGHGRAPKPVSNDNDLTVLNCWQCSGNGCRKCARTGKLFWANGYASPYTEQGQKSAQAVVFKERRNRTNDDAETNRR